MYLNLRPGLHLHALCGCIKYPHGQGFIAATNINLAGKVKTPFALEIVTSASSSG
jgi:hypothetical protein